MNFSMHSWVKDILTAATLPLPTSVTDYSDLDKWFSDEKARDALEKLRVAGYELFGNIGDEVSVTTKDNKGNGLSFTWDDPEEEGLVGVWLWDNSFLDA